MSFAVLVLYTTCLASRLGQRPSQVFYGLYHLFGFSARIISFTASSPAALAWIFELGQRPLQVSLLVPLGWLLARTVSFAGLALCTTRLASQLGQTHFHH